MSIYAYSGVSKDELEKERYTKRDFNKENSYTLNHSEELLVNMKHNSKGETNAQGWNRDGEYYFKELRQKHPEFFDEKNNRKIDYGDSPEANRQFIKHNPQYARFEGESLIHHHIGGDGQAVAIPQSVHSKGYGEIHNIERDLGIRAEAEKFSEQVKRLCEQDPSNYGRTANEFKQMIVSQQKGDELLDKPITQPLQTQHNVPTSQKNENPAMAKYREMQKDVIGKAQTKMEEQDQQLDLKQGRVRS